MLSLNSMIPMSYHYLWASTITTINTSPHGQGDTCGWPANMDQIEHRPIWKDCDSITQPSICFFVAYHCLVFFPCWRGYFTHTLSCNTLRESCLPMAGLEVLWISFDPWFFGDQSVRYCGIEAWRRQDTICGYKSAVPWVKMVSFWWSRDFANNKSRKLKGRLLKVNSIRGKLVAGKRHESQVFGEWDPARSSSFPLEWDLFCFINKIHLRLRNPWDDMGIKHESSVTICDLQKGHSSKSRYWLKFKVCWIWAPKSYSCVEIQWNSSTLWQEFWWFAGGEFQWNSETDGCLPLFGDFRSWIIGDRQG